MSLREQFEEDLSIFFDADESAQEHTVCLPGDSDFRRIMAIIDNDQGQQNALKTQGGTYSGTLLFYARTGDLPEVVPEILLQFDGKPYRVTDVVEEGGVTQVTLQAGAGGF